jgi:hypothetical protein
LWSLDINIIVDAFMEDLEDRRIGLDAEWI